VKDFPAAHSMDTHWFAVDANGHIGYFDSSEGGAVPQTWNQTFQETKIEYGEEFLSAWNQHLPSNIIEIETSETVIFNMLDLSEITESINRANSDYRMVLRQLEQKIQETIKEKWMQIVDLLMLKSYQIFDCWSFKFISDEAFQALFKVFEFSRYDVPVIYLKSIKDTMVIADQNLVKRNIDLFRKSIFSGDIVSAKKINHCFWEKGSYFPIVGLFVYSQDSQEPIPYEKIEEPIVPLHIDDLPEAFRDSINRTRFDRVRFSETQLLQPIEHMACSTWGMKEWWIDTEGREREGHPHDA